MRINLSHNAAAATGPGKDRAADKLAIGKTGTSLRISKLLLVAALVCVLTTSVLAQTPSPAAGADAYVQQFESSYRDVRRLRADFTQTYTLGTRPPRVESGQLAFERGGLMRWDYQRPMEKLFVSDGKQVSFYVPEEHQLTRSSLKSSEDFRVPFELLLARLNLQQGICAGGTGRCGAGPRARRPCAARLPQKGICRGVHRRLDGIKPAI